MWYQLLRPWAYLTIQHPSKWMYDWLLPGILGALSCVALVIFRDHINIFGNDGLIPQFVSFVQGLPGFFVAALAAVATFNRADLDNLMTSPTLQVEILIGENKNTIDLTRRRFLSMLFSFLTAESILFVFLGIIFTNFAPGITALIDSQIWLSSTGISPYHLKEALFILGTAGLSVVFWQLITSTMLGLYYLGDRIHQPDSKPKE